MMAFAKVEFLRMVFRVEGPNRESLYVKTVTNTLEEGVRQAIEFYDTSKHKIKDYFIVPNDEPFTNMHSKKVYENQLKKLG